MPSDTAPWLLMKLGPAASIPLARSRRCNAAKKAEFAASISGRQYIGRLAGHVISPFAPDFDWSSIAAAGEFGMRRQEPSSRDLAVAAKHEFSIIRQDALTMLPPNARDFPPGQRRKDVMNNVKIIPEKQQTENPVRFDNRGAFARPLAPAMLGETTHHAQHQTGVDELRKVLQSRHLEDFGDEQQDQGHRDEVANPDAEICQVAGDHITDFLDEEVWCA